MKRLSELVNIDSIMAAGNAGTRAAKGSTSTIPIVMLGGYYPDELGFVASIAHPSRNITGLARSFDRAFFGKDPPDPQGGGAQGVYHERRPRGGLVC